ncbi:MAG TPA: hypothetical protein VGS27_34130 [Candidatus Sulfotelmatobacter sp.]|nr:hypothetical protein [Candidatus Sulfotelmatobacter sp.]
MSIAAWDIVFVFITLAFMLGGALWLRYVVDGQVKSQRRGKRRRK